MSTTTTSTSRPSACKSRGPASPAKLPPPPLHRTRAKSFWMAAIAVVVLATLAFSSSAALLTWYQPAPSMYGPPERLVSMDELKKHVVKDSAWVVIDGQVWDVTNTIMKHPAGPRYIIDRVGTDITDEFHRHHSREGLLGMLESQPNRIKRVGVLEKRKE